MADYTDTTPMPFGKYKNEKLANVPATYLMWVYENAKTDTNLIKYIEENMDCLQCEIEEGKKRCQQPD